MDEKKPFGPASGCQNLAELVPLQRRVIGNEAKKAVAAYGMLLGARSALGGEYYEDALEVLNCLGATKAELDKAACHSKPTVSVTAEILFEAQKFVDEMTIACTEWPTSAEVVSCVGTNAAKYSFAGPWKRTVLGSQGEVVGVEEFNNI
jgi:hypothetical protein